MLRNERLKTEMDRLQGAHFALESDSATFFKSMGVRLSDKRWAMDDVLGTTPCLHEQNAVSILPLIRECIEEDVKAGNGDKIAQLQLLPRQAVVFFLEGQLTREHLANATEGPDFIDIPNVELEGRKLTVRVFMESEYSVATADSTGTVLSGES